ncbi:MAG: tftA, partial [Alphaproteobacteria bacterium]|nr:tftA [Alphaproteobacteria bacterium]
MTPDISSLIDDRLDEGIFRVRREAFVDRDLYDLEIARIFEGTWIYIGLESQIAKPNDFFTTTIGRQPVLVTRGADGIAAAFLNSCRHRGTLLCPLRKGNSKVHVCQYHGWAYDSRGRNVGISRQDLGQYGEAFDRESHDLVPVARFASYRGLLFASLSSDVPSLEEHLGDARIFIDLVADQAPDGLEYVPGSVSYTFDANWKFQFENGLDYYHFETVHRSFVDVLQQRSNRSQALSPGAHLADPEPQAQGTFSFARGHAVMWSIGVPGQGPEAR